MYCVGYADGVVEHTKGIHHGIKAQATANPTHFIGEAGTQEEQTVAIGDGLIEWFNIYFSLEYHFCLTPCPSPRGEGCELLGIVYYVLN